MTKYTLKILWFEHRKISKVCLAILQHEFGILQNQKHWRNTGGTAEHPGIPAEHQRNTSGTPQNNGTIQNKEQLQ